jgi:hypothetical protein
MLLHLPFNKEQKGRLNHKMLLSINNVDPKLAVQVCTLDDLSGPQAMKEFHNSFPMLLSRRKPYVGVKVLMRTCEVQLLHCIFPSQIKAM